ncbi:hypothetical protein ACVWXM_006756 [Bradyrhizobium sp. GM7.3]
MPVKAFISHKKKAFISHKKEDAEQAAFKGNGLFVYLDVIDIQLGKTGPDLADYIRGQLDQCTQLLAVISARTQASWWVPWEICGFRGLRPEIPIERDHAFRSKAATCSDEGGRGVVAGMRSWVRFSSRRQDWRVGQLFSACCLL